MPPKDSNSTSSHGKLKFSSIRPKHSNSTSNMVDPEARSIKVEPGISSLKRPYPGTSTSSNKKLKVSLPAQKSTQMSSKYISASDEAGLRNLLRIQAERRNKAHKDNNTKADLKAVPAMNAIKSNSKPITKSNKINLSNMHQHPGTSISATKKPEVVSVKQEVTQKSTETAREDSPGFDEFVEKENLSYHVEEDNDVAPDSESEFDFEPDLFVKEDNDEALNPEDDEDHLDIEDDNNTLTLETHDDSDSDSGFEAYYEKEATTLDIEAFYDRDSTPEEDDSDVEVPEDEVDHEEGAQIFDPDEDDIFNSDPEDNVVESNLGDDRVNSNDEDNVVENNSNLEDNEVENTIQPDPNNGKDDLSTLTYAQLKRMCTDPVSLAHYGTGYLFTATMRANFSRMVLDQLDALPLDMVPKKYHSILDQVKREKEMEKFHAIDDLAYDIYFPDDGEQRPSHHRILVYKGNRSVVTPAARYR